MSVHVGRGAHCPERAECEAGATLVANEDEILMQPQVATPSQLRALGPRGEVRTRVAPLDPAAKRLGHQRRRDTVVPPVRVEPADREERLATGVQEQTCGDDVV